MAMSTSFYSQPALSADQVLSPYVWTFYAAFIIAYIFTPVMRSVAIYYGIVDRPDLVRKLHSQPVAYLGGVAVFIGWIAGLAMTQFAASHVTQLPGMPERLTIAPAILVAAIIIVTLGLWDDTKHISPRIKIAGQLLAAVALLSNGIGVDVTKFLVNNIIIRVEARLALDVTLETRNAWIHWITLATSIPLTAGLIIFCCNASNLMDGLDGLCGGVTGIIAIGFVILAIILAQASGNYATMDDLRDRANGDGMRLVIALALLGSVLGFVPYNFNPASIFMGDTGSMFLGFICAIMILLLGGVDGKWLLAGMVMFALPVLDTSLAFARRWVAGRPFFSADRHHFHHQLVQRGLSVKQAVLVSYVLTAFFVACGIMMVYLRTRYAVAFYLVLFGSIIVAAYKMGMVHERQVLEKAAKIDKSSSTVTHEEIGTEGVLEIRKDRPAVDI